MHAQHALVRWCHEKHIRCVAWSPLAKYGATISQHPLLLAVAQRHDVPVPVVMLRWQVQSGVAVIPRSSSALHIVENTRVWNFALSKEEMELVDGIDEACRVTRDCVGVFEDTPFCPWGAIGIAVVGLLRVFWLFVPNLLDFRMPQKSKQELILRDLPSGACKELLRPMLLVLLVYGACFLREALP